MKKILVLTPDLKNIGGVANYYKTLALNQAENIDYFYVNSASSESPIKKVIRIISNYIVYWKKLKSKEYSLVHINPSLDRKSFYRDAFFTFFAIAAKKEILIFFRGWNEKFEEQIHKSSLKHFIFNNTFGKSQNLILLSSYFQQKVKKLAPLIGKRHLWLETTVADDKFLPLLDINIKSQSSPVNFLFLARLVKEKGIFIALDTFEAIQKKYSSQEFNFFVGGDGPDLQAAKEYTRGNAISNVHFLGFVSGDKKGELLLKSHILLFPTFHGEGLPNTVLEAMLYGMPVISRVNAGIPDVVTHEENGFLSESLSSEEFIEFADMLISNKQVFKEMVLKNHNKAKNLYIRDKVKERLLGIYNEILNENICP